MSKNEVMTHLKTHFDSKSRTKTKHNVAKPSVTKEFHCDICHTKFTQWKNYERHKRQAYDAEDNVINVCEICGHRLFTSRLLNAHHASHKVSCATCDQDFTTKRALDHHMQKRNSVACGQCGIQFCNKKAYCVHMSYVHRMVNI